MRLTFLPSLPTKKFEFHVGPFLSTSRFYSFSLNKFCGPLVFCHHQSLRHLYSNKPLSPMQSGIMPLSLFLTMKAFVSIIYSISIKLHNATLFFMSDTKQSSRGIRCFYDVFGIYGIRSIIIVPEFFIS